MKRNRKNLFATLILLAGLLGMLSAPALSDESPSMVLPVGETLTYSVMWGVIPVGSSIVTVEPAEPPHEGLVVIRVRTRSNKVLATLYPVDDVIESYVDPETLLPVKFVKQLNEGRYHTHEETLFDHEAGVATLRKLLSGKTKTYEIKKDTRDLLAFLYFMRRDRMEPGQEMHRQVMADEKLYDLYMRAKEIESVRLPNHGKVRSLKIEPEAAFQGLFVRKGRMTVWVSDDDRRIFTRVVADTPFAKVRVKLVKVSNGGEDFWTKQRKQVKKSKAKHRRGR